MSVKIFVVTPHEAVNKMRAAGFRSGGRSNAFTHTLSKVFTDEEAARKYGYKLNFVYTIESLSRDVRDE